MFAILADWSGCRTFSPKILSVGLTKVDNMCLIIENQFSWMHYAVKYLGISLA